MKCAVYNKSLIVSYLRNDSRSLSVSEMFRPTILLLVIGISAFRLMPFKENVHIHLYLDKGMPLILEKSYKGVQLGMTQFMDEF